MAGHLLDELEARGLVSAISDRDGLAALLRDGPVTAYCGFDPTGASLHAGSLLPLVLLTHLQRAGHRPLAVVGGATGMIGDPSGRGQERALLEPDALARNAAALRGQLSRFLRFGDGPTDAAMVDNADWLAPLGLLDFLRDVGKHVSVNTMLAKESVRARLEDREQGISYTEFSYMLLQAYDFVALQRRHGCRLQVGGSDQWGNITAGHDLGHKLGTPRLYGLVCPLLTDASGQKLGKTAAGTRVWLDPALTSPYRFYQHWINVDDADVGRLLRLLTFVPLEELVRLDEAHRGAPERREAQRRLARDLTAWVHGPDAARRAEAASQVLFGGALDGLSDADLAPLVDEVPATTLSRAELEAGQPLVDLAARLFGKSKAEVRRLIASGGLYVNNRRADDPARALGPGDLASATMLLLRAGKKSYHLVRVG